MPTIVPAPGQAAELARRLLDLAGDQPERVKTVTTGPAIAFDVDDDLAKKATAPRRGRPPKQPDPQPETTPEPAAEPVPAEPEQAQEDTDPDG